MSTKATESNKLARVPRTIYNVELERKLVTEYNFNLLIEEVEKLRLRKNRVTVNSLVDTVRKGVKVRMETMHLLYQSEPLLK